MINFNDNIQLKTVNTNQGYSPTEKVYRIMRNRLIRIYS